MNKNVTFIMLFAFNLSYGQQYSQKWSDVNFVGDGKVYHNMDIYLPKATKSKYPIVVHYYGSAYMSDNSKGADMNNIGSALLDAGFAVVVPNYRSVSDAIYPAQINDVKAVIRFLRGNSQTYKLDTSFIGISGCSSGGQLAALAGTTNHVKSYTVGTATVNIEGTLGNFTSYSSDVDATCDWFGPTNFLTMDSCGSSISNNDANSPASKLVGGPIQSNKDKVALTNPATFIDPSDPPFLIIQGDKDALVNECQSISFYNSLQKKGVSSQLIIAPGGGHYDNLTLTTANINSEVQFFLGRLNAVVTSVETNDVATDQNVFIYWYKSTQGSVVHLSSIQNMVNYEVMDLSGKRVANGLVEGNEISLPSLQNGLYLINFQLTSGKVISKKVLVY
jgi:acetyl esterase/lipase